MSGRHRVPVLMRSSPAPLHTSTVSIQRGPYTGNSSQLWLQHKQERQSVQSWQQIQPEGTQHSPPRLSWQAGPWATNPCSSTRMRPSLGINSSQNWLAAQLTQPTTLQHLWGSQQLSSSGSSWVRRKGRALQVDPLHKSHPCWEGSPVNAQHSPSPVTESWGLGTSIRASKSQQDFLGHRSLVFLLFVLSQVCIPA